MDRSAEYYIAAYASGDALGAHERELIPAAALRRRMSRIVRMGVAAGMECVRKAGCEPDAILTATGLGCLTDSERFLRSVLNGDGLPPNPTPFIHSTFNTVGSQLALLCGSHAYNMTYTHRSRGFAWALLDGIMLLDEGKARSVLVGAFDETTATQRRIMERMGAWRKGCPGEGAVFVMLSHKPSPSGRVCLREVEFPDAPLDERRCRERYARGAGSEVVWNDCDRAGVWFTASGYAFLRGVKAVEAGAPAAVVYNSWFGDEPSIIRLECIP